MKYLICLFLIILSHNAFSIEMSSEGLTELIHYQPLHDCYDKFLRNSGQSGRKVGKITFDLKLSKTGDVLAVKENSNKSTIHEDVLNSCVFQSLKNLKFPQDASGKEKEISTTLDFPIKKHK